MRNYYKLSDEYREKFCKGDGKKGAIFFTSELYQFFDDAKERGELCAPTLVMHALNAGFMSGYKFCKKEEKKVAEKKSQKLLLRAINVLQKTGFIRTIESYEKQNSLLVEKETLEALYNIAKSGDAVNAISWAMLWGYHNGVQERKEG